MPETESTYTAAYVNTKILNNYASECCDKLRTAECLYVDIETYGDTEYGADALDVLTNRIRLVTVGSAADNVVIFDVYWFPLEEIFEILEGKKLVGHNLLFDLAVLVRHGMPYPDHVRDTMLTSQVLTSGMLDESYSLVGCVERHLKREIVKEYGGSDWRQLELSTAQLEYAFNDVRVLVELDTFLCRRLGDLKLGHIAELEWSILPAIVAMTLRGIGVDKVQWLARSVKAKIQMVEEERSLNKIFPRPDELKPVTVRKTAKGTPYVRDLKKNERIDLVNESRKWNWGSWQQVLKAFHLIGFDLVDSGGFQSTSYETITRYKGLHPAFDHFLKFRDVQKEATAFGEQWLKHVHPLTNRVHPSWRQLGARGGRMTCSDPNIQQCPRGELREGITASDGCVFVRADYSQIEARVAAKISGDKTMLRLFQDNRDIHTFTASQVLGKPIEEVTKKDRQTGKSLVFGLLFGMSAPSLREYCRVSYGVHLTEKEAEVFRERFFKTYKGLATWHRKVRDMCDYAKEYRTLLGRRRIVTEDVGNRFGLGTNMTVQGSAADLLKISVRELWRERYSFPDVGVVMLVHDEIVLEVPESQVIEVSAWLKDTMVRVGNRVINPVPCDAEVKIGKTWGG